METALLLVFKRLSPAMLLRITAVCKQWNTIVSNEELWLSALARESKRQPGCSVHESYILNYKTCLAFVREKRITAKKLYIKRRKSQFKQMEYTKKGSTANFRIFPNT